MQIIPVTNDPINQTFNTVLGGVEVVLNIWYQDISSGWYISMMFPNGTKIISGARLNSSSRLLASTFSDFVGDIIPAPTLFPGEELGISPWGITHNLLYLTNADLTEAGFVI
jgi:hypothetical protein